MFFFTVWFLVTLWNLLSVCLSVLCSPGPFPETQQGNTKVTVLIDYFSKWPEAFPVQKTDALSVARCISKCIYRWKHFTKSWLKRMFLRCNLPECLISFYCMRPVYVPLKPNFWEFLTQYNSCHELPPNLWWKATFRLLIFNSNSCWYTQNYTILKPDFDLTLLSVRSGLVPRKQ